MIDKINAEADAIGCGKDEKIKALEDLLKIAIRERDEALAYSERLLCAWEAVKSTDWDEPMNEIINEQQPAALAALKAEWQEEAFGIAAQICEKKANEYANGNYEHGSRQHGKIVAANSCAYEIRAYVIRQREQVAGE